MPPKSKKEQEEEAQRLLEEQKRKEEEEARIALEKQKYAAETISTGLLLPASNQIFIDLYSQTTAFLTNKLEQALKDSLPSLEADGNLKKLIVKELIHYLIAAAKIFGVENKKQTGGIQNQLLKARALVGISLKLMTNQHPVLGGSGKQKKADEQLFKDLMTLHVQKGQGKLKLFDLKEAQKVLKCITSGFFNHYLLLQNYQHFQKRQSEVQQHIYISAPSTAHNQKDTLFTDLSEKNIKQTKETEQNKPNE